MLLPDPDTCYRAVQSRDTRFDGWFFTAVRTTGIYCRPSCPALTPHRRNVVFHPSAAAAQRAGFRACKRCIPDAAPGSPQWNARGDLAGRAVRLIVDGVVDRDGVPGLARRLGYSERQVQRALVAEVGAGPLALARAQRAQTARMLLETTDMPITDLAFAAGFSSVRQFNETVHQVYAATPSQLRARRRPSPGDPGTVLLRLPYRRPMSLSTTLALLADEDLPGLQIRDGEQVSRVFSAPLGPVLVTVSKGDDAVLLKVRLTDARDLVTVVARVRRWLDLDADPTAVDAVLSADPSLAPLVAARRGLRAPGSVDGFEAAVRLVLGQDSSPALARDHVQRLLREQGTVAWDGESWRLFPAAETLAGLDPAVLPSSSGRALTVSALASAVADGDLQLDPGADRDQLRAALLDVPGLSPETADKVLMRAAGHPDVLPTSETSIRRAARTLGLDLEVAQRQWSPWRTYATHHLWRTEPALEEQAGSTVSDMLVPAGLRTSPPTAAAETHQVDRRPSSPSYSSA